MKILMILFFTHLVRLNYIFFIGFHFAQLQKSRKENKYGISLLNGTNKFDFELMLKILCRQIIYT